MPAEDDCHASEPSDSDPRSSSGSAPESAPGHSDRALYRVLDANANRAFEGLRVVEDYVRFVLQDSDLQRRYKTLRHELRSATRHLPDNDLIGLRDAGGDVGATNETVSEYTRRDTADVAQASTKRLEQSLRSLEEYAKPVSLDAARQFERCRYAAYELARILQQRIRGRVLIPEPALYVLISGQRTLDDCLRLVESLIEAGVSFVQLRDKQLEDRQLLARGRAVAELCRGTDTRLIINDRPDLARLTGADGVHVGQDELEVSDVRELVGPRPLIGVSTHTREQLEEAIRAGADYVGCGPTFPSNTKTFDRFSGTAFLHEAHELSRIPAFAIGGINLDNLPQVLATGFRRVAVGHAVTGQADPGAAARRLLGVLREHVTSK